MAGSSEVSTYDILLPEEQLDPDLSDYKLLPVHELIVRQAHSVLDEGSGFTTELPTNNISGSTSTPIHSEVYIQYDCSGIYAASSTC